MSEQAARYGDQEIQLTPGSIAILTAKQQAREAAEKAFMDALSTTLVAVGVVGVFKKLDLSTGIVTIGSSLAAVPEEGDG